MDSRTKSIQDILGLMQKNLECSICLDLLTNPVSTKCDHPFCRFCITEFLKTKTSVPCPLCKCPITKRSLNDRPQLSNIVENVRRLMGAFSKDTGQKCSPPRASSSANLLSCTPEQLPRKEAKGTKRKISVSEKKGTAGKSNVRQSKRRKSDLTPEVMESTQDNTETDIINETADGLETDQHVINTALNHRINKEKENQEESKSGLILSCLKSDAGGTLSEKGDPSCTNPKALTKGNTKPGNINLKGRTKSISHLSGPEKDEEMGVSGKANPKELTKEKKELGDTNLKSREKRTRSTSLVSGPEGEKMARTAGNLNSERHLRAQNKKNYKEDSDEIDFNDDDEQVQGHSESQGHSELSSLPESTPHVATVTRTYDKQFVSHRNVRSVSKVKDWLTSNDVHGKVPGDSQESDKVLHGGSLEQSSNSGDNGENFIEDEEEFELVSCDSSIPESIVDKEHADTSDKNPRHSETASTSLSLCSDNLPPTSKSQTEKGGQVAHKIFKTTRNDKHLETSVKQTKGKFLFKKIQPKSVLGIDQVMGVKPLKPKDRAVITQKESLKLRELDLNTFGNDSDPYEFKSSQVTPVKPKVHRRKAKARDDKRKEGQISVEVQNMLSRKSGKSILKKANGDDLKEGMSGRGGEGAEGKKKKLSPKALQRQKDEEEALKEMRDKISQAESYDLVTSTQEVIDHLTEEENGAEEEHDSVSKNKKIVSFNQDVIFISSQNQNGVKSLKGVGESPKNRKTQLNYIEKNFTEEAGVRTSKNGGGNQETEEVFRDDCETGAHHKEKVEVQDTSENFIDEISENVLSSKENKAGNLKVTSPEDEDNDDGNSSSTTDLDIHPGESEFAVPNLDIQPKEILEKLSSQDIIPNIAVNENNRTANCDTEMEVDIVPNSEDLGKDTGVPNYKRKSGIEAMAKNPTRKKVKEGCKRDDDNVNLNKGDRQQRYIIQELEDSSSLAVFGGEELEAEGNCQKVDVKGREADVNSVNVVPETPLIAIDSEASVTDASSQPQEKKLIRKSRLKKSNKEKTCKKSPVATKNEESQKKEKGTDLTNLPSTKDKEMSENIVPPSVDVFSTDLHSMDVVVLDQQSGKEGSGSISTHLSSETQDSQTSLGSKFKESERTSTQQSSETQNSQACTVRKLKNSKKKRGNRKAVPFVIQETPVLGEAKVRDEEVTETWKQKQNTDVVTDSQQSMSSLCSTQESVSILAPVHKSFEKVVDKKSPDFLKENLQAVNKNKGEDKDIIELKSRENEAEDLQGKSLSCEIIPEEEDSPIVIAESKQSTRSTYNKLRRPKRKCFSLGSPEEAPKRESQARNKLSKVDDEEMEKQGSRKKEEVQTGKCEEDLEIVEDLEKKQRIPEINPSEVNSSGDVKSTPSDALIPTQLSLRSIKKQEMKLKKQQQQSSPEDVFLMDSEPLGSGSGYQDLVQNQEGLLELELGDLDGVNEMETRESQVRSSSGRASGEVEDSMDGDSEHVEKSSNVKDYRKDKVEHIQCSGSGNDRPNEDNEGKNSETVTTVPDTEENEEVLVPKRRSSLRSASTQMFPLTVMFHK
ncbi:breast cancer type 1 susceptibility protein homolog [Saccostrea cucullata]|uniref:breast cancer type 1 susceptibility protein homolog n=1 Tax=Saccostrea cuccullata TaxID=36930 RepID=UPI002ED47D4D